MRLPRPHTGPEVEQHYLTRPDEAPHQERTFGFSRSYGSECGQRAWLPAARAPTERAVLDGRYASRLRLGGTFLGGVASDLGSARALNSRFHLTSASRRDIWGPLSVPVRVAVETSDAAASSPAILSTRCPAEIPAMLRFVRDGGAHLWVDVAVGKLSYRYHLAYSVGALQRRRG